MLRIARVVLVLALLMGVVWMGQGIGLIPGSFMTGRIEWSVYGSLLAGIAAIGLWWTTRPKAS